MQNLSLRFIALLLFVLILIGCNEGATKKQLDGTVKVSSATDSSKIQSFVDPLTSLVDTLYLEEKDYVDYYDNSDESGKRQNKAVFQYSWVNRNSNRFLTMAIFPSKGHKYTSLPRLFLRNANTGSKIMLSDSVILGDQQLKKVKSGTGSTRPLAEIRRRLKAPGEQLIVFVPYESSKHLIYKIYVINIPDGFTKVNFNLPPESFVENTDPSPPADAED